MMHQMAFTRYIKKAINNNSLKQYIIDTNIKYFEAAERTIKSINSHLNYKCTFPQGGLYTCISVNQDGGEFVENVLKNTGVLFVPGWGFGRSLKNAVRVSYGPLVNNLDLIDEGFEKVANYINN